MITNSTKGVFALEDAYKKIASGCWVYDAGSDPGALTLWSWGYNDRGTLGKGDRIHRSSPVQIPGTTWCKAGISSIHSMALKSDNTLWTWGANQTGNLGDNCRGNYKCSPVQIPGNSWNDISSGSCVGRSVLARKTDGTLWAWGENPQGNLGDNTTIYRSSPVQIPGTSWCGIAAGRLVGMALKTDGTLWSWGTNYIGNIGDNTAGTLAKKSSPVQIPGTSWIEISNSYNQSVARKSDGTLWVWGRNTRGEIGDNTTIHRSSPVQVPGSSWNGIDSGQCNTMATKTDGTLWLWGSNYDGALGLNDTDHRSSPVQLPGSWCNKMSLEKVSFGIKTDGTLWAWGNNQFATLGLNDTAHRSSPVQVPGTQWSQIFGGTRTTLAIKCVP